MAKKEMKKKTVTAAERVGRALGLAAKRMDTLKAAAKKVVSRKPVAKKAKKDPAAEAARAKTRAAWKSQAKKAASSELSKHGALVDERARVRATDGTRWAARKPR